MIEFHAHELAYCYSFLDHVWKISNSSKPDELISRQDKITILQALQDADRQCVKMRLKVASSHADRAFRRVQADDCKYGDAGHECNEVRLQLHEELKDKLYFHVPEDDSKYYTDQNPFGEGAAQKFPKVNSDIHESGKCLALDRSTACVFHLMRVIEHAVQKFGKKLGVKLAGEKEWQVILNELNKPIQSMPRSTPKQKTKQAKLSEVHQCLFHVKLAWRNPVMHPKDSYTLTEAREIYGDVRRFMAHLAAVL